MAKQLSSLEEAAMRIEDFGSGPALAARIKELEAAGSGLRPRQIEKVLAREDVGSELLAAARTIKALAGQVNVIMHAAGILTSLPYILEPSEIDARWTSGRHPPLARQQPGEAPRDRRSDAEEQRNNQQQDANSLR